MQTFETIEQGKVQYYITKMNEGDKEARKKIIYHYSNLVLKIIENDYNNQDYSREDLFQAGILGVLTAIKTTKENNPHVFSAKMNRYIHLKINTYINNENKYTTNKYNNTIEEIDTTFIQNYKEKEDYEIVLDAIKKLSKTKQDIIYLYFYKGLKQEYIAQIYHISRARVQQILKDSILHIKKILINKKTKKQPIWKFKPIKLETDNKEKKYSQNISKMINVYEPFIINYINCIIEIVETNYNDYTYAKDDLIQAGVIGLLNAIDKYAKSKPEMLFQKINENINFEINKYINNELAYYKNKYNDNLESIVFDFLEYYEKTECIQMILDIIKKNLPKIEQNVIQLYFFENFELVKIAEKYNLNVSYIQQVLKCGIKHIKILLNKKTQQKEINKKSQNKIN